TDARKWRWHDPFTVFPPLDTAGALPPICCQSSFSLLRMTGQKVKAVQGPASCVPARKKARAPGAVTPETKGGLAIVRRESKLRRPARLLVIVGQTASRMAPGIFDRNKGGIGNPVGKRLVAGGDRVAVITSFLDDQALAQVEQLLFPRQSLECD